MQPISDVRDISHIAYGFMASKALFAALEFDLFSRLSGQSKSLQQLAQETAVNPNQLLTLLTACVSLGLLVHEGEGYHNAPASETYLVRSAPAYFGDYYRFQVDRQIYPLLEQLNNALRGEQTTSLYEMVEAQREEAAAFSHAQHSGSLGPAYLLARQVDFSQTRRLLDVAGGSGAFSITLCQHNPQLSATILDFPNVIEVASQFVAEADLSSRIDFVPGNALDTVWPGQQDAVLMSYLLSAVAESEIFNLVEHAYRVLKPGGRLFIHDFMLHDDRSGPPDAALWFLSLTFNHQAVSFTPAWLMERIRAAGFGDVSSRDLIAGITRLLIATKPH